MLSKSKSEIINNIKEIISEKRNALIAAGISIIGIFLIFIAFRFYKSEKNTVYELLSPSSVVLMESEDLTEVMKECRSSSSMFSSVPFLEFLYTHLNEDPLLDSLINFSDKQKVYISLNAAGKSDVDLIYYLKRDKEKAHADFEKLVKQDASLTLDHRLFNDIMIYDLGRRGERKKFSFIFYKEYFIGSFSGFLLEDVIRNFERNKDLNWTKANDFDGIKTSTKIFINHKNLPGYLSLYCTPKYVKGLKGLESFASYSGVTWEKEGSGLILNGKTVAEEKQFLYTFRNQTPVKFSMGSVIPENASTIFRLSVSDFSSWFAEYDKINEEISLNGGSFQQLNKTVQLIKDEVAWVIVEPEFSDRIFQYAIIKTSDANNFMTAFRSIADSSTSVTSANPNRKIYAVHKKDILTHLFGPVFSDFKEYFITSHGNFVVIGNQLAALETYLQQVQNGYVLKKTPGIKFFTEPSNVSLYINPARSEFLAGKCIRDTQIKNNWTRSSASLSYTGISFSIGSDGKFSFRYIIQKGKAGATETPKSLAVNKTIQFNTGLISEAYPLRVISGLEEHFLVQDSLFNTHLFSRFGTLLWSAKVEGKLSTEPVWGNIDKKGKDEIVFAVRNKIYAINSANGQVIKGFPLAIAGKVHITSLALIDYDGSKNYRIFAGDDSGSIYALDTQGKLLDGWKPKKIDYSLVGRPYHVRVADKDYIIALSRKGKLHVFNRKGQLIDGFPIKLEHATTSPFFIEKSSSASNSYISILSEKGELVKVDFTGKIAKRTQLFRLSPESKFSLYPDDRIKSYTIVRKDKDRLDFLDMSLSPLFTQTNFPLDKYDIKYIHSIAANISYWLVIDLTNRRSILFTPNGKFLGEGWIKSQEKPTAVYLEKYNEGSLVKVNKKSIEIVRIR
ncbi:hypothetical protein MYP_2465 [Sporocytophaga myxococcoides]|uniref:Uncharacterized protein n=1 Tax=Sporocytophaga myxococcoides TaxID=153721 RepID=A0A098LEB3_9BACT|nr:PQQ-binding-like beta-propeller repeat protein [Sporocytophaga myxococcoides]GAL85236.1 hypothetical protein MYP_2465 [Sporocytophaga myxococcoides]